MTPTWAPWPVAAPAGFGGHKTLSATTGQHAPPQQGTRTPVLEEEDRIPAQPIAACALSPEPESVRAGRAFTRATLTEWGMAGLADTAELVVSELVTNALRHGVPSAPRQPQARPVRLRLLAQAPLVMCMVSDPGPGIPVLRESGPAAESGRGLTVVEACSVRWGWHLLDQGGKVVWALLRPSL